MPQKKVTFTRRQIRFASVLAAKGRYGVDFSDVVRRWVDAGIAQFIRDGHLTEEDGGYLDEIDEIQD